MSAMATETTPAQAGARRALVGLDPEAVRYGLERRLLARLEAAPDFAELAARVLADIAPTRTRSLLMATSLRLTESMAPNAHRLAAEAMRLLGIKGTLEIYQSSGPENAALHHHQEPILVELQGRTLSLLDDGAMLAALGHELGHYLAHGPSSDIGRLELAAMVLASAGRLPKELTAVTRSLSVARELTADRFELLVTQDLDATLRLEMAQTTGLPADALSWDTRAYLAQCRELMELCLEGGDEALSTTHPEHSLRAYALWLYSETREYKALTGQGPGTRALAEVDGVLDRILGRADLDTSYSPLEAPPPELHECALAASVMVASADGEICEEESETIERVFAPLVSDWEAYLDIDFARERFAETALVLRGGGPDLMRSLFTLLTHVMGADGVIDKQEAGVILSIGRALGEGPLFERWLIATFRALGAPIVITDVPAVPIPLPARRDDVLEALDAFIDGVERRGGGSISMRRLLRLIGHEALGREAVLALSGAFEARGVDTEPALDRAKIDDLLALTPTPREGTAAPVDKPAMEESRRQLLQGLTRLRDQLISGDGRSPSVRLRAIRKGRNFDLFSLEQVSVGMAERVLAQVQAGRQARLIDPAEAGSHRGAQACVTALVELDRAHRDRLEESGSNDLYLGHLFLTGAVGHESALAGYAVRAPLVLYPVDLVRDGRGARGFHLAPRKDDPPVVNQSLLRLVFAKKRYAFPDSLAEELDALVADPASGADALVAKLRELGLDVERPARALSALEAKPDLDEHGLWLSVDDHAVLGLFPQSSSDLLQDYDALLRELSDPAADLDATLAAARLLLPAAFRVEGRDEDARSGYPLIVADPTQREVLDECRRSLGVVVDGPPGTGKSQVIANLVLDAVRRGEKVAVVCEKRAALDVVYQRIDGLGLGQALALVHDVHEDRKPLYEQIARRVEDFQAARFNAAAAEATEARHGEVTGALDARTSLLRVGVAGSELRVGQLYVLKAGLAGAGLDGEPLRPLSQEQVEVLLEALETLHPLQDLWGPASPFRAPAGMPARASMAGLDAAAIGGLATALGEAEAKARAYEAALGSATVPVESLDEAAPVLATDRETRALRASDDAAPVYRAALSRAGNEAEIAEKLEDAEREVERAHDALAVVPEPVSLALTNELEASVAVLRHWSGRFLRFFLWSWWSARSVVRAAVRQTWPQEAATPFDGPYIERLQARIAASKAWSAAKLGLEALGAAGSLPKQSAGLASRLRLARSLLRHAASLRRAAPALNAIGLTQAELDPTRWDAEVDRRLAWVAALGELRTALSSLTLYFPWLDEDSSSDELGALRQRFEREARRLVQADVQRAKVASISSALLPLLDALTALDAAPEAWRQATLHAWASAKIKALELADPALARLGSPDDDADAARLVKQLDELESARSAVELKRVAAQLDAAPFLRVVPAEKGKRRSPEQALREELLKETRKKRSVMALRTFVRKYAQQGLLDVVPVWLLSPETMTILFPREACFDLVVFDEASQCTVESGLPVLLRARRVVVAGDEKQMPPTSFFKLGGGNGGDEDEDVTDDETPGRDMLQEESLLTLARTRLSHAGLKWHYRCHHESLIAFSNHAMYAGDLRTIPSTRSRAAADALCWVAVPDGVYNQGENEPEARRVVELIHELFSDPKAPSIGVVTFNLKQRRVILDAIERRVADDPAFAALWNTAITHERIDERPFVKNLESVQGDERDVIIFSLGHAPVTRTRRDGSTDVYVPARFGPLGQRGGERRLNVAISRAKRGCYIVASFEPRLLSAASSQHRGPKLFRDYLEFAHGMSHGRRAQAERVLDRVREGGSRGELRARPLPMDAYLPLGAQLSLALEEAGIAHDRDIGASDFRVPIAIFDPKDGERYALALLLDDGGDDAGAFEAFVHRPTTLRVRGWRVMHLTAATWARRRESVLDAIKALLHSEPATPQQAPAAPQQAPAAPQQPPTT